MSKNKTLQLYKWSFKKRGIDGQSSADDFCEEVSAMPAKEKMAAPESGFYVFGQPDPVFDGGWRGTSDIRSVTKINKNTLRVSTAGASIILSLEDFLPML